MDNKKKLQAEYLQLAIDNEKIKEQRVSDYNNPNKPPPIPPQYKTNAEIQNDAMEQQKMVIDNLRTLGLDYQVAAQISQDLKNNIAGGDGNFLKFNKNFPYFKEKIEKGFNAKNATVLEMIEKIKDYFDDIDNSMGLTLVGTKATNFFANKPLTAVSILPSREMYEQLEAEVDAILGRLSLNPATTAVLKAQITSIINESPTDDELRDIDSFPNIEKTKLNRATEILITKFHFPTSEFIYNANNSFGTITNAPQALTVLGTISRSLGMVNTTSLDKLKEFVVKIREEQAKLFASATGLAPIPTTPSGVPITNAAALFAQNRKDNKDYIRSEINKMNTYLLTQRLTNPATQIIDGNAVYDSYFINHAPTVDGNPPNGATDESDNMIYEVVRGTTTTKKGKTLIKNRATIQLRNGQDIDTHGVGEIEQRAFDHSTSEWNIVPSGDVYNIKRFLWKAFLDETSNTTTPFYQNRMKNDAMKNEITTKEYPVLEHLLDTNAGYDPRLDPASWIAPNLNELGAVVGGFGVKRRIKLGKGTPTKQQQIAWNAIDDQEKARNDYEAQQKANNDNTNRLLGGGRIKKGRGGDPNDPWRNTGYTSAYHPNMTPEQYKASKYGKGMKKKKYDSDSDSDKEQIHIDINSHNGKNYKMSGDGFIKRRIKIGKGIEINKDEPKFRAFGKYIIHMHQLHNNNILNFKHKSGGTIPSIKPVNIDENFKDFIIDVVDSGRVNDRHFESLTEPEKNHFLKVVRGAGIIEHLKLKQSNHDIEKEELNRLDLLLGEVDAGNDNANMIKEAKTLIKKYVSNGRISRQKGFDMLAELE